MRNKVKIELNSPGVVELMKSAEMIGVLEGYADEMMKALPDGYEKRVRPSVGDRAKAYVGTNTYWSRVDNAENNTLLQVLGGMKHD